MPRRGVFGEDLQGRVPPDPERAEGQERERTLPPRPLVSLAIRHDPHRVLGATRHVTRMTVSHLPHASHMPKTSKSEAVRARRPASWDFENVEFV